MIGALWAIILGALGFGIAIGAAITGWERKPRKKKSVVAVIKEGLK